MNKLFRKTRGQSRTLASNDDASETSDDAAKSLATDSDHHHQQQSGVISSAETTMKNIGGGGGDTFDVVLRLEVPSVPKLRSSSIDASCLHQGEMNDVEGSSTAAASCRENSPTGSDASSVDREQGATTSTGTSSLLRVDLPKCFRRRSLEVPRLCIHCVHLETMAAATGARDDTSGCSSPAASDAAAPDSRCSTPSDADLSSDEDEDLAGDSTTDCIVPPLSAAAAAAFDMSRAELPPWRRLQELKARHSDDRHKFYLTSPDSQTFPVASAAPATDTCDDTDSVNERASSGGGSNRSSVGSGDGAVSPGGDWKEIVTLQVPLIKPRSSSLDVTYYASTLRPQDAGDANADDERRCSCENLALPDAAKHRSTSVDVSLPTDASGGSYRAITCYATDSNKYV